jgi:DNA topoisomerase-3
MENAGSRSIENKEDQKALSNIGIEPLPPGHPLLKPAQQKLYRQKKQNPASTDKGLQVYNLVKDKKIANVQMTAEWEIALDKIEKGELNKTQFMNDIQAYTAEITSELLSLHIPQENIPQLKCPKCQQHNLIIKDKIVKCPDEQCNWILFRIFAEYNSILKILLYY